MLATVAGCGGLGKPHGDAAHIDGKASDLAPLEQDSLPPAHDSAVLPDAGSDTESVPLDADGAEASAGIDTERIPPATDAGVAMEAPAPPPATIVVLPDTQYYAASYPDVFTMQTNWILEQRPSIAAVLHVGDVVDGDTATQWTVANSAMRLLDNHVPYFLVPGNHDTDGNRKTMIDNYFGPASMPWVTGTMTAGQIENNYALVDIGPQKWLILGLEFGPRDSVLAWANDVLKDPRYSQYPVILVTHAYLYSDGTRYDINVGGTDSSKSNYQNWSPWYYRYTAADGINDGEAMWQKLVLPNSQIRLVFCGHQTGWARLSSTRPNGSVVHQMLSDYQWYRTDQSDYYGGGGYLRVVQFDFSKKQLNVRTYSPYLDQYLTDDANQFSLPMQP